MKTPHGKGLAASRGWTATSSGRLGGLGLLGLAISSGLATSCSGSDDAARPRNLLVICVDTLRADHLGAYGNTPSRTPAIDALGRTGTVFEHAVSHASWTLPSFASVLTSLYTSTHGCWDKESRLSESFVTLPEHFREAGFRTAGIASHVFFNDKFGLQQGFDEFDDEFAKQRKDRGWEPITSPTISHKAALWLDQRGDEAVAEPWLLWLHYFDPHYPYVPHDVEAQAPENTRYRSEIAFTDGYVGEVLQALERNGFGEDTAVVFLSDHGEAFEEHAGVRRHAKSLHREELRVPLIVRVPGIAPGRVEPFVRTVDLLPTLLELFGIRPDPQPVMEGRSLLPLMRGRPYEPQSLLAEIRLHDGFHADGLIDGRWKLIENVSRGKTQLYDLERDFDEREDLAAARPEVVEELRAELERLRSRATELGTLFERGGTVQLSPAELERLEKIGYTDSGELPDPDGSSESVPEAGGGE